jgi:hypothetical protein
MKKLWHNNIFWEGIGYFTLALLVFGQIAVGYIYLTAQIVYLTANLLCVVRDIAIKLPRANLVKDICFSAITCGLIAIYII